MKEEKLAKISYINNEEREGYLVEILSDNEWGLNSFYPLVRRENEREEEEKDFVHFGILNTINELQKLNFRIIFK